MNIQIITSSYPAFPDDPSGTAGLFVRAFALELMRQGHQVVIQPVARKDHYIPDPGLVIEPLPWRGGDRELASMNLFSLSNWLIFLDFFRRARPKVLQVHAQYQIERTLCMWAVPAGLLGFWMKKAVGKPYDVWVLGSDLWKISKIPIFGTMLLKMVLGAAERVFADGIGLCRDVERIAGRHCAFLPSSRILPSPRANRQSTQEKETIDLLFVGRYHPNKGPDLLLEAFRRVACPEQSRLRLELYGVGPLKPALLDFVREHRLENIVTVHDGIGAADLADALLRCDYLVIPSRIESIPVIFSDALQVGTPVIATPVGDLPELVTNHQCGVVAECLTPEALSQAIDKVYSQGQREHWAENALRLAETFRIADTARKWLSAQGEL